MDATEIKRLQSIANASKAQRTASTTVAKPKTRGRGGGLTAWLSELGGTGGAWAGGATGAAIGSAVPGIGTVIGGLIGAGIGGFAGGTTGKLAENKIRDDEFRVSQALGEGAMEGLFSAGPIKLGKIGAVGAKTLLKGAAKEGGEKLLEEGAKSAAKFGVKTTAREAIEESLGKSLLGKVGSSARRLEARSTGLGVGEKIGGKKLSTEESKRLLDTAIKEGVPAGHPEVKLKFVESKLNEVGSQIDDNLLKNNRLLTDKERLNVIGDFTNRVNSDITLKNNPTAQKVLNELQTGMSEVDDFSSFVKAKRNIQDQINYARSSTSKTPKTEAVLNHAQQALNEFTGGLNKDLKALNKRFGDLSSISEGLGNASSKLSKSSESGGSGLIMSVLKGDTAQSLKSMAGRTGMKATKEVAGETIKRPGLLNLLARNVAASNVNSAINPSPAEFSQTDASPQIDPTTGLPVAEEEIDPTTGLPIDTTGLMMQDTAPVDEITQLQTGLKQAALAALKAGDSKGLESIIKTAGLLESLGALGGENATEKPLSATAAESIAGAQAGLEGISLLREEMAKNPGTRAKTAIPGRGLVGGIGNRILGTSNYQAAVGNILDSWARIKTGAAISNTEEARFQANLPEAFDPPETVEKKLKIIGNLFTAVANRTGSAGTDLEDLQGGL